MSTETLEKTASVVDKTTENHEDSKKKSLLDYAKELAKNPLIKVLDEELVYGTNMWTKLMKEEAL